MFVHSIVYVVLSILTATAVFAASMPVNKPSREHQVPGPEAESTDTGDQ